MSVQDIRRYRCDSCTQSTETPLPQDTSHRPVPAGWVQATISNRSKANRTRWWCEKCVERISEILPNALGELDPFWPQGRRPSTYCGLGPCCLEGGHEGPCKQ